MSKQKQDPRINIDRQLYNQVSIMVNDYGLSVPKLVDMQLREFLQTGKLPAFKTNYSDVMFGMLNNRDMQIKYYQQQHRNHDQLIKRMLSTLLEQIQSNADEYQAWIDLASTLIDQGNFNFQAIAHDEHMLHDVRLAIDEVHQFVSSWSHVLAQHQQSNVDHFVAIMDQVYQLNYKIVFNTDLDQFYWQRVINDLLQAINEVLSVCDGQVLTNQEINLRDVLDFDWLKQLLESILKIMMPYDFNDVKVDWLDALQVFVQQQLDPKYKDYELHDWLQTVVYKV